MTERHIDLFSKTWKRYFRGKRQTNGQTPLYYTSFLSNRDERTQRNKKGKTNEKVILSKAFFEAENTTKVDHRSLFDDQAEKSLL